MEEMAAAFLENGSERVGFLLGWGGGVVSCWRWGGDEIWWHDLFGCLFWAFNFVKTLH